MADLKTFDVADYLDSEEKIAEYLTVVLEDKNPMLLAAALGDVAKRLESLLGAEWNRPYTREVAACPPCAKANTGVPWTTCMATATCFAAACRWKSGKRKTHLMQRRDGAAG